MVRDKSGGGGKGARLEPCKRATQHRTHLEDALGERGKPIEVRHLLLERRLRLVRGEGERGGNGSGELRKGIGGERVSLRLVLVVGIFGPRRDAADDGDDDAGKDQQQVRIEAGAAVEDDGDGGRRAQARQLQRLVGERLLGGELGVAVAELRGSYVVRSESLHATLGDCFQLLERLHRRRLASVLDDAQESDELVALWHGTGQWWRSVVRRRELELDVLDELDERQLRERAVL